MLSNPFKMTYSNHGLKKILLAHFFLCGIGLIKIIMLGVENIYDASFLSFAVAKMGDRALWAGIGKLGMIMQYFLGLFFLALYAMTVNFIVTYSHLRKNIIFSRKPILIIYFILNAYLTYRLVFGGSSLQHWLPYWLIFTFTLPLVWATLPIKKFPVIPKWLSLTIIATLLLQIALIFQPMIFKPMLIENDYFDIPGQTQLNTGEWVDNTQFINQHNIGGIVKYDPRVDHGKTPKLRSGTFVTVHPTTLFENFLTNNQSNRLYHLVYERNQNRLAVKGVLPDKDHLLLSYAFTDEQDKQQINKLYLLSQQQREFYQNRVYTPLESDFIQKNQTELVDQSRTGWFFYHHNYFFTPIFASAHGADLSQLTMVYGWANTLLFAKLLTWMGGVNYQNYFHLFFAFYLPYYIGFLCLVLVLFNQLEYGLLALILTVAGLMGLGIEVIRLWPGLNPVRHFLDLPVFLSFYLYAKNRKLPWLLLSYFCSFIALLCSKEFGLFLIASLSAAVVLRALYEKKSLLPACLAILFFMVGLVAFGLTPGKNPGYVYLLLGFGSPVTPSGLVVLSLFISGLMYYAAIVFRKIKDPINYFWLSVLFYCQFLMVYVLWFPMPHHLFNIASSLALLVLCFVYLLQRHLKTTARERNALSILVVLGLIVYVPTMAMFYVNSQHYYRNFVTHKLYAWPFATAQVNSTMDPQLFLHAASLIQKYAPENSIYILSRFDDLLPVLAGKYSALPYNELLTNLVTPNDIHGLAELIKAKQPRYLFVDTDIERNFNNDIFMPDDSLTAQHKLDIASLDRVIAITGVQKVFAELKEEYRPIAKSELITVYEKIV